MSLIYKNITTSEEIITAGTGSVLIDSHTDGSLSQKLDSINICNVHATDSVDIDLYYSYIVYNPRLKGDYNILPSIEVLGEDQVENIVNYYVLKNVTIPKGVTLNLDNLSFDNTIYLLKIKLSAADSAVDVIIDAEIKGTITTTSTLLLPVLDTFNSGNEITNNIGEVGPSNSSGTY